MFLFTFHGLIGWLFDGFMVVLPVHVVLLLFFNLYGGFGGFKVIASLMTSLDNWVVGPLYSFTKQDHA